MENNNKSLGIITFSVIILQFLYPSLYLNSVYNPILVLAAILIWTVSRIIYDLSVSNKESNIPLHLIFSVFLIFEVDPTILTVVYFITLAYDILYSAVDHKTTPKYIKYAVAARCILLILAWVMTGYDIYIHTIDCIIIMFAYNIVIEWNH